MIIRRVFWVRIFFRSHRETDFHLSSSFVFHSTPFILICLSKPCVRARDLFKGTEPSIEHTITNIIYMTEMTAVNSNAIDQPNQFDWNQIRSLARSLSLSRRCNATLAYVNLIVGNRILKPTNWSLTILFNDSRKFIVDFQNEIFLFTWRLQILLNFYCFELNFWK